MKRRLSTPRRICVIALCACAAAFLITPAPIASAAGACVANGKPLADGTFTRSSPFGQRGSEFHRGMDLAGKVGTNIFASMDGKVVQAGPASGFGNWIIVDSQTRTGLVSTVYGHMFDDGVLVKPGATVKEGDHIANVGNNGQSTGPHLHFEYWKGGRLNGGQAVDPSFVLDQQPTGDSTSTQVSSTADCQTAVVKPGMVPPEFAPWVVKAGQTCQGITSAVLAAQLEAENGFHHGSSAPVSSTGAQGPAQFMPGTWKTWGKDYDNSGPPPDVNSIPDAVMSQGALMCENYRECAAAIASGSVNGDPVALALAAYNAGFGAVQKAGGMPSGGDYTTQTQPYVAKIMQRSLAFAADPALGGGGGGQVPVVVSSDGGELTIMSAAGKFKGKKWVWGGGSVDGPTDDGFDSAGLTYFAVAKGTKGRVVLPRTVDEQWNTGKEVPMAQVQPGDLVFNGWTKQGRPSHVGIAVGNGQAISADTSRGVVTADFYPESRARRVT